MTAIERCVHGLPLGIACGLCRIDRQARIGAHTAEQLRGLFISGVCAMDPPVTGGEHERCRMIACECSCHRREDYGAMLGRALGIRKGATR